MGDLISKATVKEMFDNGKIVIDEDVLNCNSIHETLLYLLNKIAEFVDEKVDEIPVIDAAPVVHGEWVDGVCSVCKTEAFSTSWDEAVYDYDWEENPCFSHIESHIEQHLTDFCPNCGADMRKDV